MVYASNSTVANVWYILYLLETYISEIALSLSYQVYLHNYVQYHANLSEGYQSLGMLISFSDLVPIDIIHYFNFIILNTKKAFNKLMLI